MIVINKLVELKSNRIEYERNLKNEYEKYYANVRQYIMASSILDVQKEEVMSDVIEMFLDYQENDKDIEALLGEDHEKFCREIIESLKTTKLGKIYSLIMGLEYIIWVLVMQLIVAILCSTLKIGGFERLDSLDFMTILASGIFVGISTGKYRIKNIYTPWSINKLEFLKDLKFLSVGILVVILLNQTVIKHIDFYVNNSIMIFMVFIGLILLFLVNIMKFTLSKGMK
ncbi:DUF1048 domain-containing protein [Oceanirhabdus sp. W0125-5]|uniref:DUF1048 domain-containing protein n=1 Tax=Oceanirhabdus sp. W0125-5 TaxID=2999116 RepID=UPI0022F306B5|nr:DUF1048 domain-containing protein [Oceanirhabdus sp. W0125-5]WBW98190.1 DUF1048 domain-containing protein [Oceanirhabdus sp. W0125-5]